MSLSPAVIDAMVANGATVQELADAYKAHLLEEERERQLKVQAGRMRTHRGYRKRS